MRKVIPYAAAVLMAVLALRFVPVLGALLEIWAEREPADGQAGIGGGLLGIALAPFVAAAAAFVTWKLTTKAFRQ